MHHCKQAIPEGNDNQLLLPHPSLREDFNNDKSAIDPPGGTGDHQHHHLVRPCRLEDKDAFGLDQDVSDATDQLAFNRDSRIDREKEPASASGFEQGSDGAAAIDAHQQCQPLPRRLSDLGDNETVYSPAALGIYPRPGDEDTAISAPLENSGFPCSSSSAIPSSAILTLQSPLLPNVASTPGNDEPKMSSSSLPAGDPSLSSSKPYPRATTPPWRATNAPPGLSLVSSPGMFPSGGDPSTTAVTLVSQPYSRGDYDDVSHAEDRTSFPAPDWSPQEQGSDSTMAPWSPTLAETGLPPLIPSWDEISGSTMPFETHPGHKSAIASPYNNANAPAPLSPSYPAATAGFAVGLPSFGSTDTASGYAQSSLYPSSLIRLDPAALAEYARYPTINRSVSSLQDALPPSSAPGNFLPYPHPSYYNGSGYRPSSYTSSTVEMYSPSRSGTSSGSSFSVSTPVGAGPSSRSFSMPTLPSYERISSNLMISAPDPYSSSTAASNPLYNPSMAGLPSFNMDGSSSTVTYNGSHHSTRNPQKLHGKARPFFKARDGTVRMRRNIPEHEPCTICEITQSAVWKRDANDAWVCSGCYMLTSLDHNSPVQEPATLASVAGDGSSSSVATSSSRPFSFSPSLSVSSYRHGNNSPSTGRVKKSTRVKSAAVLVRSGSPLYQERATRPVRLSSPPRSEQSFKIKLRSSGGRSPYPQVQQALSRPTTSGRGATAHRIQEELVATPVSTKGKAKKKSPPKIPSYGTAASVDDAPVPISITMIDHTTSISGQHFDTLATRGGGQGDFDAGADGYGYRVNEGGRVREYNNNDWRDHPHPQSSSSMSFYPDEPEPFLPSPEGSRSSNSNASGGGGSIDHQSHHYQQQNEQPSYQKRNTRFSRSYTQQPYHGYHQHQHQQPRQRHHHIQQQHQEYYDRQQEFHRYHPTPPSEFPYCPPDTVNSYQSEVLTMTAPGSSAPTIASATAAAGASNSATVALRAPTQASVRSSSSAIPGDSTNGPVVVTISGYQDGSFTPMVRTKHGRDGSDHRRQDFKKVKLEKEGGGEIGGEGKEVSITNTGSDLSSAGGFDSDE
ncbi:hypothetical protein BGW39_001831 [Mortierella sp. 14UC]|nr:hypothetical protein BGW39_001831 [Mortierella sp. 14UC]